MTRSLLVVAALLLAGCPKEKNGDADASATAGSASASASVAAAPLDAGPPKEKGSAYEGKYTSAPSTLYIPADNKDYASVKQAKDDGTKMVGDGTLSLAVDGAGRLSGTIDSGPIAPALVEGVVSDGSVSGSVRRKEAGDQGLTGSLFGKVTPDGLDLTMRLSDANAGILREAKASLKKK